MPNHYDTCRPGYCASCGQREGYCNCGKKLTENERDLLSRSKSGRKTIKALGRKPRQPKLLTKVQAVNEILLERARSATTKTGISSVVRACASLQMTRGECCLVLNRLDICSPAGKIYNSNNPALQELLDEELARYNWPLPSLDELIERNAKKGADEIWRSDDK